MDNEHTIPKEEDNIDCHLQQIGMGSLVCKAVKQTGDSTTNEVNAQICFNCPAGKIYREIGCDAVLPKLIIYAGFSGPVAVDLQKLFCKIRKRDTSFEYCKTCGLVVAETTRNLVSIARGLFEAQGFYSAYKDIERARECIRDGNFENAVTRSIACLESVMTVCHEKMEYPLPEKKQVSDLWKSTRTMLKFDSFDSSGSVLTLTNSIAGVVTHLGGIRNALGDAHGKGTYLVPVSESIAELAINVSSALATLIIRSFNQMKGDSK